MADNREVERLRYVLDVVLREAEAYAMGWRMDWSGFDGRDLLRHQIRPLVEWARAVASGADLPEYKDGTEFYESR